jgi:putative transposase
MTGWVRFELPTGSVSHCRDNSTTTPELLDQLLANYEKPEDLTGDDGLFRQLKKALIERALGAELTEHLG